MLTTSQIYQQSAHVIYKVVYDCLVGSVVNHQDGQQQCQRIPNGGILTNDHSMPYLIQFYFGTVGERLGEAGEDGAREAAEGFPGLL